MASHLPNQMIGIDARSNTIVFQDGIAAIREIT
jgi:hypothetical protein